MPHLLLADDDPDDWQLISEELARKHPEIMTHHAISGHDVLQYLSRCQVEELPAVLLLDYQMPGLTGPEVLQELSVDHRYKGIVKIMWSNSHRTKDMEDCKRLGAADYLIKPGSNEELERLVARLSMICNNARLVP